MYNNKIQVVTDGALIKLVYNMAAGESIRRFDDGMLSNNTIKGIVSCSVSYEQGSTRLIYSLNVKPSLASMLRQSMKKNMVLSIFKEIAGVMQNSQSYMLSERNFVLDPRYIFIDTSKLTVEMIYIPTNDVCGVNLAQFIKTCISLGVFDTSMDSSYLTQLLNFVNTHEDISAFGLIKLIDEMMSDKVPSVPPSRPVVQVAQPIQMVNPQPAAAQNKPAGIPVQPVNQPSQQPQKTVSGKQKNGLFGSLLGKSKDTSSSKDNNPVSAPQPATGFSGIAIPGVNQLIMDNENGAPMAISPNKQEPKQAPTKKTPFLVDRNGKSTVIDRSPFWIGKSRQSQIVNSLVIDGDAGISKNHAYIECVNGKYYIVDPKSTNGTFINGKMIAKNSRTELKDGMKIGFWKAEFIFKVK